MDNGGPVPLSVRAEENRGSEDALERSGQAPVLGTALLYAERVEHLGGAVKGDPRGSLPDGHRCQEDRNQPILSPRESIARVMLSVELLQANKVLFNILCVLSTRIARCASINRCATAAARNSVTARAAISRTWIISEAHKMIFGKSVEPLRKELTRMGITAPVGRCRDTHAEA